MSAGYSGTPLARKLGIEEGHRVVTLGAPGNLEEILRPLPDGVRLEADPEAPSSLDAAGARSRDVILLFAPDRDALESGLPPARRFLAWDGGLWVCWPKQSSPLATEMRESDVRAAGLAEGLVDNKICAVDADWSGLRFVHRREDRP